MMDIAIRGGEVVDGTGSPRRRADVGIDGGRVVTIGRIDDDAARTIDASGMVVAPGFVDVHTHYDAQVFWDPTLSPSCLHGVTTVVGGNCGFTVAPLDDQAADYLMRMLARVEGMPLESLEVGVPWDWRTTGEYLERLEGRLSLNAGFMVGHSSLRRVVMGKAATERRATPDELATMKSLLHDGLAAGGLGFSSTLAQSHTDADGNPVPSRHAAPEEIVELAGICREHPGTSLEFLPHAGRAFPHAVVDLMAAMSVAAQRPLNWNIIQVRADNLEEVHQKLDASDVARRRGGKVIGLLMPMRVESRFNFASGFVLDMLPGWEQPLALPLPERLDLLADPTQRRRLEELAAQPSEAAHLADWGRYEIREAFTPETKRYMGRRVSDIARDEGKRAFDALLDVVCADRLRTTFGFPVDADTDADWEARATVLRDPRIVVGASDAGAHLDMLGTFNYPTMLLAQAVREQQVLSLEEAVRLLTQAPALLYGLAGRGVLAPGAHADVVIFDEAAVGSEPLAAKADLPGGASRLYAGSTGVQCVLVNGETIVSNGTVTDRRPGTVLRSGRDTFTPSLT